MSAVVVAAARAWLGTPYRHQASAPGAGCDCLGLVRGVWRTLLGREPVAVPPYGADWRGGMPEALVEAAERYLVRDAGPPRAGQVVLFSLLRHRPPRHCGVMTASDRFIHAQERMGVVEVPLTPAWAGRIAGLYRFPGY